MPRKIRFQTIENKINNIASTFYSSSRREISYSVSMEIYRILKRAGYRHMAVKPKADHIELWQELPHFKRSKPVIIYPSFKRKGDFWVLQRIDFEHVHNKKERLRCYDDYLRSQGIISNL